MSATENVEEIGPVPVKSDVRHRIAVICANSSLRLIDEMFILSGCESDWWTQPKWSPAGERNARTYGWYAGIRKFAPDREATILSLVCEMIQGNPYFDTEVRLSVPAILESLSGGRSSAAPRVAQLSSLHQRVIDVASRLFHDGHYQQAIFQACLALNKSVQEKSCRFDLDGTKLMQHVFSINAPVLKFEGHPDEQQGYMWLFSGMVMAIRNPRGHQIAEEKTVEEVLDILAMISSLFRALDRTVKV